MLEVLDSSQRSRLTAGGGGDGGEQEEEEEETLDAHSARVGSELAYLTHEGLFISDALNEAEQQPPEPRSAAAQGQARRDACGSDSASATTESSSSREHAANATATLPGGLATGL